MADLQAKLRKMQLSLQRDALIQSAKAGAQIIVDDANGRSNSSGRSFDYRVAQKQSDLFEATVEVGATKKKFYLFFQEFGTGHRFLSAKAREYGFPGISRRPRPAVPPHPALIPALESKREAAAEAMKQSMIERVTQASK